MSDQLNPSNLAADEKTIHFTEEEFDAELTKRWSSAKDAGHRELAKKIDGIVRGTLAAGLKFDGGFGGGVHVDPKTTQLALQKVMDEIGSWVR